MNQGSYFKCYWGWIEGRKLKDETLIMLVLYTITHEGMEINGGPDFPSDHQISNSDAGLCLPLSQKAGGPPDPWK